MNKLYARLLLMLTIFLFWAFCSPRAKAENYSWQEKIVEAKFKLSKMKLAHSVKTVVYKETRKVVAQPSKAQSKKKKPKSKTITTKRTDYAWKEAGLAIINVETGEIKLAVIKKEGQKLGNYGIGFLVLDKFPQKFVIEIEPRVNGLTWNGRNTAFRVAYPLSGWVVIANKWIERVNGKAVESMYVPYSSGLYNTNLSQIGNAHLYSDIGVALNTLYAYNVRSLARPDKRVSEIVVASYLKNIILDEQTDPQEFYAFRSGASKYNPFERVKVLLGANGKGAFPSFNYAGAIGLTQFTNNGSKILHRVGTWDTVRKAYPLARLSEFKIGATNHIESIEAAILLYDYNLSELVRTLGSGILKDKNLDYYLSAAHNCGVGRVIQSLKKPGEDWRITLRQLSKTDETNVYLDKIDYLVSKQ